MSPLTTLHTYKSSQCEQIFEVSMHNIHVEQTKSKTITNPNLNIMADHPTWRTVWGMHVPIPDDHMKIFKRIIILNLTTNDIHKIITNIYTCIISKKVK